MKKLSFTVIALIILISLNINNTSALISDSIEVGQEVRFNTDNTWEAIIQDTTLPTEFLKTLTKGKVIDIWSTGKNGKHVRSVSWTDDKEYIIAIEKVGEKNKGDIFVYPVAHIIPEQGVVIFKYSYY